MYVYSQNEVRPSMTRSGGPTNAVRETQHNAIPGHDGYERSGQSDPRVWEPVASVCIDDWILKPTCGKRGQGLSLVPSSSIGRGVQRGQMQRGEKRFGRLVYEAPAGGVLFVDAAHSRVRTQVLGELVPSVYYSDINAPICRIRVQRTRGLPLVEALQRLGRMSSFRNAMTSKIVLVAIDGADLYEDRSPETATALRQLLDMQVDIVCGVDERYPNCARLADQLWQQNVGVVKTTVERLRSGFQSRFVVKGGVSRGRFHDLREHKLNQGAKDAALLSRESFLTSSGTPVGRPHPNPTKRHCGSSLELPSDTRCSRRSSRQEHETAVEENVGDFRAEPDAGRERRSLLHAYRSRFAVSMLLREGGSGRKEALHFLEE